MDNVEVGPVFDRIEDAVVQADEVDGKILQFEGGLAVTSNIISGAYKLAGHGKVKKLLWTKKKMVIISNKY